MHELDYHRGADDNIAKVVKSMRPVSHAGFYPLQSPSRHSRPQSVVGRDDSRLKAALKQRKLELEESRAKNIELQTQVRLLGQEVGGFISVKEKMVKSFETRNLTLQASLAKAQEENEALREKLHDQARHMTEQINGLRLDLVTKEGDNREALSRVNAEWQERLNSLRISHLSELHECARKSFQDGQTNALRSRVSGLPSQPETEVKEGFNDRRDGWDHPPTEHDPRTTQWTLPAPSVPSTGVLATGQMPSNPVPSWSPQ